MKKVTAFVTSDGMVHLQHDRAKHHADERFGKAVTTLARELVHLDGKYAPTVEFIEKHVEAFADLKKLRDDRDIIDDLTDEDD